ncbi:class I SAM-dependent methyltransferase [Lysinibacillus sp. 2017]|uniref:class I SAM-dependent methyltransferase n=1 Tax=unclassified Lysinibacillus TaxID=2636778 RepID=UPI000D525C26|nr:MULTISPECIES: class I SAM-dependent methyltransferase [unclassified Lysinibacillus]AWE07178.1 class I SAM-dependent methyltransferase [Lysinibacillus sp. 2017]TGN30603.1 class I SAM-dependent methyltransferase [Lysinibacillus sp. S2017]
MLKNEFTNNLSKYANPVEYDISYKNYTADLDFIQNHLAGTKQTIIELACGTGRLAIPLAKRGHRVYGVDIDTGMLKHAQEKAELEDINIHLNVQDCTKLNLPIKSHFIYMTGNSFQHFLTNESQNALFTSVRKHLNPNGEFIFDTRNPILHELAAVEISKETLEKNGETITVISQEAYHPITQILECTSTYISPSNEYKDSINLRYTYPLEMKRLLEQHGFELINLYGSWTKARFDANSISMVVHARSNSNKI